MENKKSTSKIFRILIFIGVFIYFIFWGKNNYGHIDLEVIETAVLGSSIAYFLAMIVGIIARLTENLLIGIIGTLIFVIVALPKIGKKLSAYVSDDNQLYILSAIVVLMVIWDIYSIIKCSKQPKQVVYDEFNVIDEPEDNNDDVKAFLKNDPKSVLMFQDKLEKKLGRKPSYDELMDYIDSLEEMNL